MVEQQILLTNLQDVQRFIALTDPVHLNVLLQSGNAIISAKSFLGVLSTPMGEPSKVLIECTQEEAASYIDSIKEFHYNNLEEGN